MKRNTQQKVNNGPARPTDRKQKKAEANKFVEDCEQCLLRLITQEYKKTDSSESKVCDAFEIKVNQLLSNPFYKDRKALIIIASTNVRKALYKTIRSFNH